MFAHNTPEARVGNRIIGRWQLLRLMLTSHVNSCVLYTLGLMLCSVILASCMSGDAANPAVSASDRPNDPSTMGPETMRSSASQFLESLDEAQRHQVTYALSDTVERANWSNLPDNMFDRGGLSIGDMSDEQRRRAHDLIRASTSSQGYLKIAGTMWLDDILRKEFLARGEGDGRMSELIDSFRSKNYYISIFGDPREDANWAWQIQGHHLAACFTVVGNKIGFTPTFLGAEPYTIQSETYAGWRVLSHEVERGFALLQSLSIDQQSKTVLDGDVPGDVLAGPGRRASLLQFEGIQASALNAQQQELLQHLVEEYVRNADHAAADAQLDKIAADGLESLYFSWMGPTDDIKARFYYRVHGPSILIEYVRERGGALGRAANHVHTLVRDPGNDYGEDWLRQHYQEHH